MKQLVILGGGASGLMAAITAARILRNSPNSEDIEITIVERLEKVGRKLLATGNGRCNLSNQDMGLRHFHSQHISLAEQILQAYPLANTLQFFEELGLLLKTEDNGRIYPYCLQAAVVLDVLRNQALQLGIQERCGMEISEIFPRRKGFLLKSKAGANLQADVLVMASGGCASSKLGSDGSGYTFMKKAGHTVSNLFPAITQLKTEPELVKSLQGIKIPVGFQLQMQGEVLYQDQDEVLFTEYGISGPAAFGAARVVNTQLEEKGKRQPLYAVLDFLPDFSLEECTDRLTKRKAYFPTANMEQYMLGLINKRVGQAVLKQAGFKLSDPLQLVTPEGIRRLVQRLKGLQIRCIGTQSFQNAQVTAGGVHLHQFRTDTLESSVVPGLFACGELLDVDGDCGGYNLQWAWSSGYIAGKGAAEKLALTKA